MNANLEPKIARFWPKDGRNLHANVFTKVHHANFLLRLFSILSIIILKTLNRVPYMFSSIVLHYCPTSLLHLKITTKSL